MKLSEFLRKTWTIRFEIKALYLIVAVITLLFCIYATWENYWYSRAGLHFIKWHTHIVFTAACCCLFFVPFILAHRLIKSESTKKILLSAAAIAFTLTLLEVLLVMTGAAENYMEARSGYYQSPYERNMGNYYNIRQPNQKHVLASGEFSYPRIANSLGYSDAEWRMQKDSGTIRIATIGDSFTEGDGAPADSSYPAFLSRMLNQRSRVAEVLNAGVSGSDPFFGYKNFSDRILPYQPDLVLQTLSSDDLIFDVSWRGGWERFVNDSVLKLKEAPWWEPVVAASFVFRLLGKAMGIDVEQPGGGIKNKQHVEWLSRELHDLILRYDSAATANGVKIIWIRKPLKHEFSSEKYVFDFKIVWQQLPELKSTFIYDLLPCYIHQSQHSGLRYSDYYWKIDGHHNSLGYKMMAECIAEEIRRILQTGVIPIDSL